MQICEAGFTKYGLPFSNGLPMPTGPKCRRLPLKISHTPLFVIIYNLPFTLASHFYIYKCQEQYSPVVLRTTLRRNITLVTVTYD